MMKLGIWLLVTAAVVDAWPAVQQVPNDQAAKGFTWPWIPERGAKSSEGHKEGSDPKSDDPKPTAESIAPESERSPSPPSPPVSPEKSSAPKWPQSNPMPPLPRSGPGQEWPSPQSGNPFGPNSRGSRPGGIIAISDPRLNTGYRNLPDMQQMSMSPMFMQDGSPPMSQYPPPLVLPQLMQSQMMQDPQLMQNRYPDMVMAPTQYARPQSQEFPCCDFSNSKSIDLPIQQDGNLPVIQVQYNVAYAFSPLGWKATNVEVSNAVFSPKMDKSRTVEPPGIDAVVQSENAKPVIVVPVAPPSWMKKSVSGDGKPTEPQKEETPL